MNNTDAKKAPWWKNKIVWIVVAAILLIGAIGNALDGGTTAQSAQSTKAIEPLSLPETQAEDSSESAEQTPEAAPEEKRPEATTGGLKETWAMTACDQHGDQQFPYGYKAHWILGAIANELDTENDEWYFKFTADVTNEYNATRETTIECHVTGSNEAPQIVSFLVY